MRNAPPFTVQLPRHTAALFVATLVACSGGDADESPDAGGTFDSGLQATDSAPSSETDAMAGGRQLDSSLVSSCATLEGRAVVSENAGTMSISFTEAESPFAFYGSVQLELPSGFSGAVPNPEDWDGESPRNVVAVTSTAFALHGNHCWFNEMPAAPGSVTVTEFRPNEGVLDVTFNNLALRSCQGSTVCTVDGSVVTDGTGVYE